MVTVELDVALDSLQVARRSELEAALQTVESARVEVDGARDTAVGSAGAALASADQAQQAALEVNGANAQLSAMQLLLNSLTIDPVNSLSVWEIQAKAFDLAQGSATYGAISNRLGAWTMPNGAASYISMVLALPSHWTKVDVYVKWVNTVANTGNVVLGGEVHKFAVGESINVTPVGGSAILAANAAPLVVVESKVAADLIIDSTRLTTLRIARQGGSANDTLPNPLAILSVRLQKKD